MHDSSSKNDADTQRVLFVCLGNICRSPLAEGVFREEARRRGVLGRLHIDSCGTGGWHAGDPPDPRSVEVASRHGIDIGQQRARRLRESDYVDFDWIVAMDRSNESDLRQRCPKGSPCTILRLTELISPSPGPDVPDPYYGGPGGFDKVYGLLRDAAGPLLDRVLAQDAG